MATDKKIQEKANGKRPVLVAVDFSPDSEAALAWACDYADCIKAPLLILHVVHDPAHDPGFYRQEGEDWSRPMSDVAERLLNEFMDKMKSQHPHNKSLKNARVNLTVGLPPGRIIEIAEAENARIIIVGSCGRTGLPHILLGSVAEQVVQMARIPVVVLKGDRENDEET